MELKVLSARDLSGLISMQRASEAMKEAFAMLALGRVSAPPRTHVNVFPAAGKTLLMGACIEDRGLAAKIVSFFPENPRKGRPAVNGLIVVLDEGTGEPRALCEGTCLTALRTGAATCASIELLAREDARVGALIGAGGQAAMQLVALDTARDLSEIRVFSRTRDGAQNFVAEMRGQVRARLELASSANEAVDGADVVVAASSSSTPVFDGKLLAAGTHVTAIGSISEAMEEVDAVTVSRARVFVDTKEGALAEAGELIQGVRRKLTVPDDWTELGLVVARKAPGRRNTEDVTFFKSVGHAVQDVAISRLALELAEERGLGSTLTL